MIAKIFSFVKVSESSMIASVRIARFVSEVLNIPVCWDETIAEEPLDVLLIVNGAYAFSGNKLLAALGSAIENAGRVVWIQNDYTIIPPKCDSGAESPFRKAFRNRYDAKKPPPDYWTTVMDMSRPGVAKSGHRIGEQSHYINWNALTMEAAFKPKPFAQRISPEYMIYYGAYRKDREKYFERYFGSPMIPTLISCPTNKFRDEFDHPLITHESKLVDLYTYLGEFGLGLYLEDRLSHNAFHSPGNRFYEMLSAGLPMVFQPEAMRMMEKAGYDLQDWIIWNSGDAPKLLEQQEKIALDQRDVWWQKACGERELLPMLVDTYWSQLLEATRFSA